MLLSLVSRPGNVESMPAPIVPQSSQKAQAFARKSLVVNTLLFLPRPVNTINANSEIHCIFGA